MERGIYVYCIFVQELLFLKKPKTLKQQCFTTVRIQGPGAIPRNPVDIKTTILHSGGPTLWSGRSGFSGRDLGLQAAVLGPLVARFRLCAK